MEDKDDIAKLHGRQQEQYSLEFFTSFAACCQLRYLGPLELFDTGTSTETLEMRCDDKRVPHYPSARRITRRTGSQLRRQNPEAGRSTPNLYA